MGDYNPTAPKILGLEWVPIRDELIVLSPDVNDVEYGHEFTLLTSRILQSGRYYIHDMDAINNDNTVMMISVYNAEKVDEVGPVRRTIIPVESTAATGVISSSGRTGPAILLTPQFSDYLLFDGTVAESSLSISFDMGQYTQDLTNKRILGVNVLLGGQRGAVTDFITTQLNRSQDFFGIVATDPVIYDIGDAFNTSTEPIVVSRIPLGAFCWHWQNPVTSEFVPWKFTDLARFDASSGSRLYIQVGCGTNVGGGFAGFAFLYYCALEVLYVEENRVAYGGLGHAPATGQDSFRYGANIVTMRDAVTRAINPTLPAGRYTVTVWSGEAGSAGPVSPVLPQLNAVRELYSIPPHPGVLVSVPSPLDLTAVDKTITATQTHVLPQLSLHASGGPLTEAHVYGRQAVAQVWGSLFAQQEILDGAAGAAASWPHVRFYARRWGDTSVPLVLDSPDIAGSSVQITSAEFDALEEINSDWKEVTLRFATPPSMGTGANPRWRWTAAGETAGNRWEVLGAIAPAVSGVAGNLFNLVPSPHQLSTATYGAPSAGSTINAQWVPQYAPPVSAISDDATTDMVLIFGQDMPTITGVSIALQSQELVGIGLDCGVDPCCIPSAILYNRITWPLPAGTGFAEDSFSRVVAAGGWGTADSGQAWTTTTVPATDLSVNGTQGLNTVSVLAGDRLVWLDVGGPDQDVRVSGSISDSAESGQLRLGAVGRLTDAGNYYWAEFRYVSDGTAELRVRKRVANVQSDIAVVVLSNLKPTTTTARNLRFQVFGTSPVQLKAKVWDSATPEPNDWLIKTTDTSLTTGNNAGGFARDDTGAATTVFSYDNFSVVPPDFNFGYYELQRMDIVETDWKTIMQATNPAVTGFCDFEARVGILSSYRIRGVDHYGFEGPWSSEVTMTIPTPGASGGDCIANGHVLLFTSNERQDGSVNLAYASVWEDRVEEGFNFAEAGFVQLQAMYGADFFTAFRPTERGGEQFSRTLLVQAAAIAPETLGDFTGLRDMAWDSVSYVCVRDEDGNRWLATVLVPNGRVLRDRRLYLANVTIIEVTDTPSPVGVA